MSDEEMTLHTPVEGDGYYTSKALQWVDLCPHMGAPEKVLLRVLTNLTTKESPTRKLSPEELRSMVYSGPVELGKEPKQVSSSGLLRLLRSLAALGQITAPDGTPVTFSSRASAQLRGVSMAIWRYPKHDCGCARNTFDALEITRGKQPRFGPTSTDLAATWPEPPADQAGQLSNPSGQEVNPRGQEVNPRGQEVNPDTQRDLQEGAPPFSSSPSSSCTSSSSPPAPRDAGDAEVPGDTPPGREDDHVQEHEEDRDAPSAAPNETGDDHVDLQETAEKLVDGAVRLWPSSAMPPNARDRYRLVGRLMDELADGGDPKVIHHELTRDLNTAASVLRVVMGARTRTAGWGRRIDPRPDHSQWEIPDPAHPWCGRCDERTRLIGTYDPARGETLPGRCRTPVVDAHGQTVACNPRTTPSVPDTGFDNERQEEAPTEDLSPDEFVAMMEASLANPQASREELLAEARAKAAEGSKNVHARKRR